jgi:hypothetical protein
MIRYSHSSTAEVARRETKFPGKLRDQLLEILVIAFEKQHEVLPSIKFVIDKRFKQATRTE